MTQRQKRPPFPIDIECIVSGFVDHPGQSFTGYFRRLKNTGTILFVYSEGYRIADLDHMNNPLVIHFKETNEKWDFYY